MAKKVEKTDRDVLKDILFKGMEDSCVDFSKSNIDVKFIPTEILGLDYALGGGRPVGRFWHIHGPESSGKTSVSSHEAGLTVNQNGKVLYVDAEFAVDPDYAKKTFKFDCTHPNVYFTQNNSGLDVLRLVERAIPHMDLIVVDSLDALMPPSMESGELGDANIGGIAKILSDFFRRITEKLYKSNCTLIMISQERVKLNIGGGWSGGGPTFTVACGEALKFYASVRCRVQRIEAIMRGDDAVGIKSIVKVEKNKVAPPFRKATLILRYGIGYDTESEIFDLAKEMGYIDNRGESGKAGAWYTFDKDIFPQFAEMKWQGQDRVIAFLKEPAQAEIMVKLKNVIVASMKGQDISAFSMSESEKAEIEKEETDVLEESE